MDSHANMCVLGKHGLLLSELETARTVNVGAFEDSAGGLSNVPIVDPMIAYDCQRTNQVYLLVLRNALYIEDMNDNLIPPFILQDAGLTVPSSNLTWYRTVFKYGFRSGFPIILPFLSKKTNDGAI